VINKVGVILGLLIYAHAMPSSRLTAVALALTIAGAVTGCTAPSATPQAQPSARTLQLTAAQVAAAFQQPGLDKLDRDWLPYEDAETLALVDPLELCGNPATTTLAPDAQDKTTMAVLHLPPPSPDDGTAAIAQYGLVFLDQAAATAAVEGLHARAKDCPSDTTLPRQPLGTGKFAPMRQVTWQTEAKSEQGWTGFAARLVSTTLEGDPLIDLQQHLTVLSSGNAVIVIRMSMSLKATRPGIPQASSWATHWTMYVVPILERLNATAP
jgi:hypothetical protein